MRASYTGADALVVEESLATPLEQEINGVDNMIYMKSTNSNDGTLVVDVSFNVGTDPDMNTVLTQNRVSAASAKLPEAATKLGVTTEKSLPNILMLLTLTSDRGYDQDFLGNYALINIQDQLARIKGVGRVDIMGAAGLLHACLDQAGQAFSDRDFCSRDHVRHSTAEHRCTRRKIRLRTCTPRDGVYLHGKAPRAL